MGKYRIEFTKVQNAHPSDLLRLDIVGPGLEDVVFICPRSSSTYEFIVNSVDALNDEAPKYMRSNELKDTVLKAVEDFGNDLEYSTYKNLRDTFNDR